MAVGLGNQLYDANGEKIYPYSKAEAITSGVAVSTNSVKDDLSDILAMALAAQLAATGGSGVQASLGVDVAYSATNYSRASDVASNDDSISWAADVVSPDNGSPYAWQRTTYTWNDDTTHTSTVIKKVYSIISTALYPETLIVFSAFNTVLAGLKGPRDYGDNLADGLNTNVKWYTYFPGISASNIYGYMAVRHRDAGQAWPSEDNYPTWNVSLFAQYPVTG